MKKYKWEDKLYKRLEINNLLKVLLVLGILLLLGLLAVLLPDRRMY